MFRLSIIIVISLLQGQFSGIAAQQVNASGTPLFNGKNFAGWFKYSGDKKVNPEELILMDPFEKHIIIKGTSPGYLVTEKKYSDYELSFEWRWALDKEKTLPNPSVIQRRKSGILFHINSEADLIWPRSIQAHLNFERAGDLQLINGFKLNVNPERRDKENAFLYLRSHDGVEKQLGEWNQGKITCHGKFVSITVNDTMVMAGRNAEYSSGRIALQSEAGEVHFRHLRIRPLTGKPVDPEKDD